VREERVVKGRHRADLVWRFQYADEAAGHVPSALATLEDVCGRGVRDSEDGSGVPLAEARIAARERAARIDAALRSLRQKPVSLARVLARRYGVVEAAAATCGVLRENAAVAAMTPEAAECFARVVGAPPRARSHDVRDWLGATCGRAQAREASGADTVAIDEVRRAAEAIVAEAESAYEAAAERARAE
jgi:hypothetical protein